MSRKLYLSVYWLGVVAVTLFIGKTTFLPGGSIYIERPLWCAVFLLLVFLIQLADSDHRAAEAPKTPEN